MPPPSGLRPMQTFDPATAAVLHDRARDAMIGWTGEHAADYRRDAAAQDDGTVRWDGMILDGWGEALGG